MIRHPVPHEVLARLQILFHDMIKADFGKGSFLILPDLVPLTELKEPEMWFPIKNVKPVGGYVGGDSRLFVSYFLLAAVCVNMGLGSFETNDVDRDIIINWWGESLLLGNLA